MNKVELKKYITENRLKGQSYEQIADKLNAMGELTPTRKTKFTVGVVHFWGKPKSGVKKRRKYRRVTSINKNSDATKWDILKIIDQSAVFQGSTKRALIDLILEHGL